MFKVNNKDTRKRKVNNKVKNKDTVDVVLASLLLTLNTFHFLGVYLGVGLYASVGGGCVNGISGGNLQSLKNKNFLYFGKLNFLALRLKNFFLYFKKELAKPEKHTKKSALKKFLVSYDVICNLYISKA